MIDFNDRQLLKLEKDVEKLGSKALPRATGQTLKQTAAIARKNYLREIDKKLVTRNSYTKKSVLFDKMNTETERNINKQRASVGSVRDYMAEQEFGVTKKAKGKHGVPVPTSSASNEGDRAIPKRKVPIAANRRKAVRYGKGTFKNVPRRHRAYVKIKVALENKDKYAYLETQKREGIYRVKGSLKKPNIKMIWDLTQKTRRIPPKPILWPASENAIKLQPSIYKQQMERQMAREKLFRGG